MGRIGLPLLRSLRCAKLMADGATMTYDIFPPPDSLKTGGL